MTIADKLLTLNTTKQSIKTAIEGKGQDTTDVPFTEYPTLIDGITTGGTPDWTYQRPTDWLPLPENELDVTRVSILALVSEVDPTVLLLSVTATGTMIDWGDGTIESVVTGFQEHTYTTASLTDITGYGNGQKQVVIKLLGGDITQLVFTSGANWQHIQNTVNILELNVNAPNLASFSVSATVTMASGLGTATHRRAQYLKCFKLGQNNLATLTSILTNCTALEYAKFEFDALNTVTSLVRTFESATSLKRIDGLSAPIASTVERMCNNCQELEIVTGSGFPQANTLVRVFADCDVLKKAFSQIEGRWEHTCTLATGTFTLQFCLSGNYTIRETILNLPSGKNVNGFEAFRGAEGLEKITFVNSINITDSRTMFWATPKLKEINLTLANTLPTDRTNLFGYSGIEKLPEWFTFDGALNLTQILQVSTLITALPDMTFSSDIDMFRAFQSMTSLKRSPNITLLGGATITNGDSMFNGSPNLEVLGSLDVSKVMANFAGSFAGFTSLVEVNYFNIDKSMNFAYCPLSATELNKIFNNLLPATGQTITITGTPGRLTCDISIATNKGWTVVQ